MTDKTFKLGGVTVTPGSKVEPLPGTAQTASLAELVAREKASIKSMGLELAQAEIEKHQQALRQAAGILPFAEQQRLLAQTIGMKSEAQRVLDLAAQLDPARSLRDMAEQLNPVDRLRMGMAQASQRDSENLLQALTREPEPVLTPRPFPDFAGMQRAEEQRRIKLAEAEGRAKAEAEFKARQELEATQHQQPQPLQQPAPEKESTEERDERWLAQEVLHKQKTKRGRMQFCEHIAQTEGFKPDTVKAALQRAEKKQAEKIREGGAVPLKPKRNTANNPFNQAKALTKKRR